jgi:hypothetical protein
MIKTYIIWGTIDDYGRIERTRYEWFEDEEVAKEKFENGKNGKWVKALKISNGNYNNYLRLLELEEEIEKLRKEFY